MAHRTAEIMMKVLSYLSSSQQIPKASSTRFSMKARTKNNTCGGVGGETAAIGGREGENEKFVFA